MKAHTIEIFLLNSDEQDDLEIATISATRAVLDQRELVT